jgi:hypothetical protein
MAILRCSQTAGKTKPQANSFKELVGRLGQRSQMAAPKYAESTKQMNSLYGNVEPSTFTLLESSLSSSFLGGS